MSFQRASVRFQMLNGNLFTTNPRRQKSGAELCNSARDRKSNRSDSAISSFARRRLQSAVSHRPVHRTSRPCRQTGRWRPGPNRHLADRRNHRCCHQWRGVKEFQWLSHDAGLSPSGCGHNQSKTKSDCWPPWRLGDRRCSPPPDSFRWFSGLCTTFRQCFW